MPLTDAACKGARPKDKLYRRADGGGLYLEVTPSGGRYWRLKYRFLGKEKRLACGVYPETSLAEAREKRAVAKKMLADGIDPSTAKQDRRQLAEINAANKRLAELNAWLEDQCIAYAKRIAHPEFKDRTIWQVYQEERDSLMEMRGPFDGFVEKVVRATTTCLIMADHNRYSVDARAAGRTVLVRTHAEHIVVLLGDEVVADHPRNFRRDQIVYDPWHYLPVLMKKPGALRNGAPFKDWALPPALSQVRAKLKSHADGDRQFVKVLGAVPDYGLEAVEAACGEALEAGIASGDVILTVLARRQQPAMPPSITTPDALRLKIEPLADCGRYDSIRKIA